MARYGNVRDIEPLPANALAAMLDHIKVRKIALGDPFKDVHKACEQLLAEVEARPTTGL